MFKKTVFIASLILVMALGFAAQGATPFSVRAFYDTQIANDEAQGPNATDGGSGTHVRDIDVRRRVTLVSFDISEAKALGLMFQDVTLSVISNSGGVMYVYGILEDFDDLGDAPLTWNTAPGVMNNPTPAVGSPVEVDTSEAVELFAFEGLPSGDTRAVSDPSQALSDFMSEDTDGIITLMFAPRDGSSVILRSSVRWNNANAGTFLEGFVGGTPKAASKPNPDNALTDVYRDTTLSWTPGGYAGSHDVYLSTIFNDVNDASRTAQMGALISQGQEATSLVPGRLDLGATYYWRVDEVNSAPDNTIFKGSVWSFTVEPKSYVLGSDAIQATASSSNVEAMPGDKTADGSGLTGDLHSTQSTDMWLSKIIIEGIVPEPSLTYEFDSLYQLDTMKVWNYNGTGEASVGWGAKDVLVESSLNGMDWVAVDSITQFNRADGMAPTGPTDTFELNGLTAKYLKISILSNWGGILNQYGLGEVQFTFVPTSARYPSPEMDAVEVDPLDVLTWRPGREAAQHVVSIGSDPEALGEGVTLNSNQAAMSDLGLQMAQTYYWTVDEVNDAEDPAVYPGDLWTFSTQEFFVVDDFERYTNFSPDRPFQTWLDGFGYSADEYFPVKFDGNGTGAGIGHDIWSPTSPHLAGDIMETDTVHSGSKAMPFYFTSAGSHTDRTFALPQDWTRAGATTLVIYFFGSPGSTGQLYATINNAKVNYSGHAANLSLPVWTQWNIDLVSINTNLQNIQTLSLGVDGNASGMILVDDIRLYVTAPPLPAEVVWVEAESGSVTAPMQVFPDSETPGASGTGYVSCPVGTADEGTAPTYPAGTLTVPFTVAGGVYTARFRVAFVGGDDSCWVRIPDAAIDSAVDASGWIHFNDIPLGETWHWSQAVKSENQGGEPPVQFTLSAGTHNIEIAYRGAELKIDAIEFSLVE